MAARSSGASGALLSSETISSRAMLSLVCVSSRCRRRAVATKASAVASANCAATALAYTSSPQAAVDRSLSLVLAAERQPTDQRLQALGDAFGPSALSMLKPEVDHLLSGGLHLGGESGYDLSVLTAETPAPDEAKVQTRERWTYDERGSDDHRARCLIETSEQTYTLQKPGVDWQVIDIQLGNSSRADCPGT